ncbi:MAG: ABC transporter ATP-binding protein [Verrucomicrobiota bacterium]|nr:ABC transporter ATP-binding protein [Verrucomicrobiota bacterium]
MKAKKGYGWRPALSTAVRLYWRTLFEGANFRSSMSAPIVVLEHLGKNYDDVAAVADVSLSIDRGEIFGFLGANGAGKTTTIKMLCGLTRQSSGTAMIDGHDTWSDRYSVRKQFGYVAQKFSLYPDLSVAENLRFFGTACGVSSETLRSRLPELLRLTDLDSKRDALAGSLSGGMKQLLALACALVHDPALFFLDEPTSGLDPVHRQQMWDLLYDLSHRGKTVFVTTHYMDEADRCTEVGFMHGGRLLAKDSPRALQERFKGQLLEVQVEPLMPGLVGLRAVAGVLGVALRRERLRIYAAAPDALLARWQAAWPLPDVRFLGHTWVAPDMEDVFKAYSQGYHEILDGPTR